MRFFALREEGREGRSFPHVMGAVLVIAAFVSGFYIGTLQNAPVDVPVLSGNGAAVAPEGVDFTPLWEAWSILEEKYVPASTTDPVSDEELVFGAVQGLAGALGDPYTVFLPPRESEVFEENIRGNFEGVGMEIGVRNGSLVVIAPLKGTPAERAGVQSGDRIVEIDGVSTEGMLIDEAVQRIRGERGTVVELTVSREGETELRSVPITRDVIEIPTIETRVEEGEASVHSDDVFVIRLFNFSAASPRLFRSALREFVEYGSDKLILDLRGNPGGFLEAAVDMASWFTSAGKPIVIEELGRKEGQKVHRSRGYNAFNENLNMVVLVNQGSASASEILAGALQEYGVATVVGERTFGKGSVQELVDVTEDSSLKVTIARWLTPNGRSISEGGLEPDIAVEMTPEDAEAGRDPQFERALEYLRSE